MADNLSPLEKNEEQLLQSALSTAFTPAPTFPQSQPESALEAPDPTPSPLYAEEPIASSSDSLDDSWHTEYESHVQSWRAQSAEAREKAEKERAKWEEIRSQEHVGDVVQVEEITSGIPAVGEAEPSPADARDLVTGEHEKPPAHTRHDTGDDSKASSQKWSDVPSDLASSYPSMSFPSPSRPTSPTHSHSHRPHRPPATHSKTPLTTQESVPLPPSTTLAIFDSSLPTKTRLSALVSSLAINCLIPFVNGVMLGFGEIFAKNFIVGWLGWKLPGSSVANVGVKSQSAGRR